MRGAGFPEAGGRCLKNYKLILYGLIMYFPPIFVDIDELLLFRDINELLLFTDVDELL